MTPGKLIATRRLLRNAGDRGGLTDTMSRVPGNGTTRRSIRVADDVWMPAAELAAAEDTSVSEVIRECLRAYVELDSDPVWRAAIDLARERGDSVFDVILTALAEYVERQ